MMKLVLRPFFAKKAQFYLILVLIPTVLVTSYIVLRPSPKPVPSDDFNLICQNFMNEATESINRCVYYNCSEQDFINNFSNFLELYSDYSKYQNLSVLVLLFSNEDYLFETFPGNIHLKLYFLNDTAEDYSFNQYAILPGNISKVRFNINNHSYDFYDELSRIKMERFNYSNMILFKSLIYSAKSKNIKICYYNESLMN